MKFTKSLRGARFVLLLAFFALSFSFVARPYEISAQTADNLQALRKQVSELLEQEKYVEALPILEKIIVADPTDAEGHFYLGFALLAQTNSLKDRAARKPLRIRARNMFIKAKELGKREPIVDALIESIPPDGNARGFSEIEEADTLMEEGEKLFTGGKIDEALAAYQKALKLDPKIYEAALFSGDMYMRKEDFANAEIWYQKAIAIDPNRETAYRYSATPLMKQNKFDLARDRYIEAYISEPYNRFTAVGLSQWAQATGANLGHPKIDIPELTEDAKGNLKGNMSLDSLMGGANSDGSTAWMTYIATRTVWRKDKFAKTFPAEKTYRHTLAEETDALRSVIAAIDADMKSNKIKTLNPQLTALKKLNDAGLLEAYILLAQPDKGIAQDHAAYLKQNRAKLKRYVSEYVATSK